MAFGSPWTPPKRKSEWTTSSRPARRPGRCGTPTVGMAAEPRMLTLALPPGPLRLLCLGAHADDVEIGCGGTVLRLLSEHPASTCRWIVFSGSEERAREARQSAHRFLAAAAPRPGGGECRSHPPPRP